MAYLVAKDREEGKKQVEQLVRAFRSQIHVFKSISYSEAQLRADFLDPLLKSLGWDVGNEAHKSHFKRDVRQEEPIDVEEEVGMRKKNPDYTLQVEGIRKIFLEAKKPSTEIPRSDVSAFQTRRYGWNAKLPIAVLSNFEHLIVYDCRYRPNGGDRAEVARYKVFHFEEFAQRFDELYRLLSFESASTGILETEFATQSPEQISFDQEFLRRIEEWREDFAVDILNHNLGLDEEQINFLVQRLLNRIVFLRICEDRDLEKYERLKGVQDYEGLKTLFGQADKKYDSGLFDFIEDSLSLEVTISTELLLKVFAELYYPLSPYDFSVVDPEILSQIYEQWLGQRIHIKSDVALTIEAEPEVVASNGVVPTPTLIVKKIVLDTLGPLVEGKGLDGLRALRIADICCGSGTFLVAAFDFLTQVYTQIMVAEEFVVTGMVETGSQGARKLTIKAKKQILLDNIFGVDINPYAVEVARFGLLLKLIENENLASANSIVSSGETILPSLDSNIKCGNSLLDEGYFEFDSSPAPELLVKLRPFQWEEEFPFLVTAGGFDAIVGNPPYVRIQNMTRYSPQELSYYQSKKSPYTVARENNIDKYYLFIQRAIELLAEHGRLGYIIPHKFFVLSGGVTLRKIIRAQASIAKIIHFGTSQVFPGRSTYTAILIITKAQCESFKVIPIRKVTEESLFNEVNSITCLNADYEEDPWIFISPEGSTLFQKLRETASTNLQSLGKIRVGLQTSADDIYLIRPTADSEGFVQFEREGERYEIEKEITVPCLWDQTIQAFSQPASNSRMIFPYKIQNGRAVVLEEVDFAEQFPKCWDYLNRFKERLEKRSIIGANPKWYQFGRSQSLVAFGSTEKLIWPVLSLQANYGFDNQNLLFTGGGNGPYYAFVPNGTYSLLYIMAILSHPAIEALVKARASHFQGGYYSHGKQFIKDIPIRTLDLSNPLEKKAYDDIVATVQSIQAAMQQLNEARLPDVKKIHSQNVSRLRKKLWEQIDQLYGITLEEIGMVLEKKYLLDSEIE